MLRSVITRARQNPHPEKNPARQHAHRRLRRATPRRAKEKSLLRYDLASSAPIDAFGESAPQTDPDGDGTSFELNLRFPGQYFDAETGLHYNYFRDYEPGTVSTPVQI